MPHRRIRTSEFLALVAAVANSALRNFYERYMCGEAVKAGWVEETDFERHPMKGGR